MSISSKDRYKRIQKAREEDAQKGRQEVARYLLAQGLTITRIVFATGLTSNEIETLKLESANKVSSKL